MTIKISENLKTDGLFSKRRMRDFVLSSLKKGKVCPVVALGIFLPQNPENLFEIIALNELRKPLYQGLDFELIGLASSRASAIMLVVELWKERRKY